MMYGIDQLMSGSISRNRPVNYQIELLDLLASIIDRYRISFLLSNDSILERLMLPNN